MRDNYLVQSTASRLLIEADANAEKLLGIVRMVVAGSIAIALTIALNAPGRPESEFLDRQGFFAATGMASYFLVGLIAFMLVVSGKYRPWMAWITAFFDCMLIASNVWLSINFAGLNTQYALAFPSALMIPLILTFGALRFRPDIQISTTVFVCLLALAIILSNPYFEMNDENILTQMSLTHALPPNMIRIWLLFSTGLVVAIAVWRAKGLLQKITLETEQRINLTRFLPATIVDNLDDEAMEDLKKGRKAFLTMMFLDVRGFTAMSEDLGIEKTGRFLNNFRSIVVDLCETHGGVVDKFIGDGALVIFGISTTREAGASSALSAAKELHHRFEEWKQSDQAIYKHAFEIGIGLHAGEVFLGIIGDDKRVEFTVIGDSVNVASRIEQLTKRENFLVLATQDVLDMSSLAHDEWIDIGLKPIRGRNQKLSIWGYSSATARL